MGVDVIATPKERPIIFSGPMILALLDGRKTQTRRVIRKPESFTRIQDCALLCPYGQPGDRLWVRETWRTDVAEMPPIDVDGNPKCVEVYRYRASDGDGDFTRWRPSIFMPRAACRITLEVTGVRVERLQQMTHMDWRADFCPSFTEVERALATFKGDDNRRDMSKAFWDSLNAARGFGWNVNPWVWVLEFRRIK